MKKLNLKDTFGKGNIIKKIKHIFSKCIRLGRKEIWIKPVQFGGNMVGGLASGIRTSTKNIMHVIEKKFFLKRKSIIAKRKA